MNVTEIRRPADMERITTPELAKTFIEEQIALIKEQVGDKKVLLALSGGVDSSVVAALLIKAIGQQLVCVHVNHGLLRKGEPEQVVEVFRNQMNANLIYVDATDRFLDKLAGVEDPEKPESLMASNSWHRVRSGRIFLSQKKASRHIIMRVVFRKIWTLNLLSL